MAAMPVVKVGSGELDPAPSGGLMKAIVQDTYGEPEAVLGLEDVARPAVKDGEVLVRVHAASVHVGDWMLVTGVPYIARPAYGLRSQRTVFRERMSREESRRSARASQSFGRAMRSSAGARAPLPSTCALRPTTSW